MKIKLQAFKDRVNELERLYNLSLIETKAIKASNNPLNCLADYELNDNQQKAVDMAIEGESFVLTGSAGTGKTLTVNAIAYSLMNSAIMDNHDKPALPMATFRDPTGGVNEQETKPAIAFVAFTNRAVNNMAGNLRKLSPELVDDMEGNFMTIHKLIEVAPEYYYDIEKGKDTMKFTPRRDSLNRLPLKVVIIEEASMVGLDLWNWLFDALPPGCQIILLGDLNQLPPVFGDSILNYGLIKLPIIELTHVYRQALDSPIIRQMHQVLAGNIPVTDGEDFQVVHGHGNKPVGPEKMGMAVASSMLNRLHDIGKYDPMVDMVLSPFNKNGCGTIMINTIISTWLDDKIKRDSPEGKGRMVYEIVSGMMKHYFAVGDVIYDNTAKMAGVISKIHINGGYYGVEPKPASDHLSRMGIMSTSAKDMDEVSNTFNYESFDVSNLLDGTDSEAEKKLLSSSHVVTLTLEDGTEVERSNAGEVNGIQFGYCLTAHKAQGCEWRRVFIIIHKSHFLANREWLYTAGTRAKEECIIIAREEVLRDVVKRQRIKGNSLEAKVSAFNEKLLSKIESSIAAGSPLPQITFNRGN